MTSENTIKRRFAEEDQRAIEAAIEGLCKHRQGRKFLWWLLQVGGVGNQPFAGNALQTSFNCGVLDVGQRILAEVTSVAPEGYLTMMKESADERRDRDAELARARDERGSPDRGYSGGDE